jgi:ATP-dependent DNA ligase
MSDEAALPLPVDTRPMEAKLADEIPSDAQAWQYEPKWDGFRFLGFRSGEAVDIRGKSGKPLGRYFPELISLLASLKTARFVVDGEIVIEVAGHYSFDALQMRLHPAKTRILKLSAQTPAKLIVFDMLADTKGRDLRNEPLSVRRNALENFVKSEKSQTIELSSVTLDPREARKWLTSRDAERTDGIVAKRRYGPYLSGERAMVKIKPLRSADCVVGGFRYLANKRQVGSLLLGLYNDVGKLDHVGFTSTIRNENRAALTKRLEKLREPPGFTGNAPGGPSRWSTERSVSWEPLRPELVVEVCFDQVTAKRFRHGARLLRWRPDKSPRQCTFEQIE